MASFYAIFLLLCYLSLEFCYAITNNITSRAILKDPDTILSNNSVYKLGFFSPMNSNNRYVGIWYDKPSNKEVVWVANRNNPLKDSSGMLKISEDGNLQVTNGQNQIFWSSNVSNPSRNSSIAQLLDSGSLVLLGFDSNGTSKKGRILWQSFESPTDSVLPNMRFSLTKNSNIKGLLQSWKSPSDPSNGRYSAGYDSKGLFQIVIYDGDRVHWRSGPWNGNIFIGTRYHNTGYGNIYVNTGSFAQEDGEGGVSLVFSGANETLLPHYVLSYQGYIAQRWWDDSKMNWDVSWQAPELECDGYAKCGEFGNCDPKSSPSCQCLKGFEPKNKEEWKRGNWSGGCVRKRQLACGVEGGKPDGFLRLQMMKVPDDLEWTVGLNQDQCRNMCLKNCSCLAYAYDTLVGCMTWRNSLIDVEVLAPGGVDLYLRLAHSELGTSKKQKVVIAASVISAVFVIAISALFLWRRCKHKSQGEKVQKQKEESENHTFETNKGQVNIDDLRLVKFEELALATNNFEDSNLLGSGGFGQVYKGKLEDGQEIAVKRLSRASGQGLEEFMNEVVVISKLQHRNLVRLLGCCVEGDEKMLIYEYMPNKSLDAFLFDPRKRELLNWETRFKIIEGISRGLLYLHRDSRLRIIHRDLKASNILLDEDLNPKISDFGMARIFGGNQNEASTRRVVGTIGYMSPEYAIEGHFSEKSDVFSFGVLLLEIVSGKKNSNFWFQDLSLSLLGYAWKLWNEDDIGSFIDPFISNASNRREIEKCIKVGLLCVQEYAKERPNIPTVMTMLVSEMGDLPKPKPPAFSHRQVPSDTASSHTSSQYGSSTNYVTFTDMSGR